MTEVQCRELLKLIGASYPTQRQRMSNDDVRAMAAAYTAGLIDLDFARAREAVCRLVKSSRWIPTIADIRDAAIDVTYGPRNPGGEAWGQCFAMVRQHGAYRRPGVDFPVADPILLATIRAFGWSSLCQSQNLHADRARFIELYDQLSANARKAIAIAPAALPAPQLPPPIEGPRAMRDLVYGLLPRGDVS